MSKNTIMAILVGLAIGIGGTLGVQALTNSELAEIDHSHMSMSDMSTGLENLSGDDFDRTYIEMMIAHHEGAVDMARLAEARAQHDEIKELSEEIIVAQEQEIDDMRRWYQEWGYNETAADLR